MFTILSYSKMVKKAENTDPQMLEKANFSAGLFYWANSEHLLEISKKQVLLSLSQT